jgi:hypothetical protein
MKANSFIIPKLLLLMMGMFLIASCIKNENDVVGDTKIRFYNYVIRDTTQDFYIDSLRLAPSIAYGSGSSYLQVPIKSMNGRNVKIISKNSSQKIANNSIEKLLQLGRFYSVYYTREKPTDSLLKFYEDDLTISDKEKAKVQFINLGYTLKSKVNIRNENGVIQLNLGYGEKSDYFLVNIDKNASIYSNVTDSIHADTILYTRFSKGKVYTILIDGSKIGKLQQQLIVNN